MEKKLVLIVLAIAFAVLLCLVFFQILAPEAPFDFAEGKKQIDKIVYDTGLSLPEYSKSHFKDEINLEDIKKFSCGATNVSNITKAMGDIENYKSTLKKYKRTPEIEAIETYADIVTATLDAAQSSLELEKAGVYKKLELASDQMNDYNLLCSNAFENLKEGFAPLEKLITKLERASAYIETLTSKENYARQADVSTEFGKGVLKLKNAKLAISETEPKIALMCDSIKKIQAELREDPFGSEKQLCVDKSLTTARIDKVADLYKKVQESAQQTYETFIKYRIAKIGGFGIEKFLDTKREFRAYELVLETLKEQLEIKCSPPIVPR
ncbi:MAG: hypothetical protein N3F05_01590 [Candidatus Diapherotrites archaeon]|nr:hypothetical protein [Candidatus Diapherotrites archaeon]